MAQKIVGYRVVAPVVVVKTMGDHGITWKHLMSGAPVPDDAEAEWIANHLRDQMITPVTVEVPDPPKPEPKPAPKAAASRASGGGGE